VSGWAGWRRRRADQNASPDGAAAIEACR
jgi:hypothetical protein